MSEDISTLRRILAEELDAVIKCLKQFQTRLNRLEVSTASTGFDHLCRVFIKEKVAKDISSKRTITTDDGKYKVVCKKSKEHSRKSASKEHSSIAYPFFFTFTIGEAKFLGQNQNSYVILICKSEKQVLRIPWNDFKELQEWIGEREDDDGKKEGFWDIHMRIDGDNQYILTRKGRRDTKALPKKYSF